MVVILGLVKRKGKTGVVLSFGIWSFISAIYF